MPGPWENFAQSPRQGPILVLHDYPDSPRAEVHPVKLILAMEKPRKCEGAFIPVSHFPFLIGRERGCNLRANLPTLGARQCALFVRKDRVFIKGIERNPETLVNDREVRGELELHDRDRVKVGVLEFTVRCEKEMAKPEPPVSADVAEEVAGDLLLAMDNDEKAEAAAPSDAGGRVETKPLPPKAQPPQPEIPDTAEAARRVLANYKTPNGTAIGARRFRQSAPPEA